MQKETKKAKMRKRGSVSQDAMQVDAPLQDAMHFSHMDAMQVDPLSHNFPVVVALGNKIDKAGAVRDTDLVVLVEQ